MWPPESAKPTRIQGAFVSEKEVKKLVDFLKNNNYSGRIHRRDY